MDVRTGIDIVHVPTFAERMERGGETFIARVFLACEGLKMTDTERAAGWFAAKEAVHKACDLAPGSWLKIVLSHEPSGRPRVSVDDQPDDALDVSIAHHGEYAVATAVLVRT